MRSRKFEGNLVSSLPLVLFLTSSAHLQNLNPQPPAANEDRLPACVSCKILATEFLSGLEHTSRSKFEGGDADYEREKMIKYEDSEVRLIEVQEFMCESRKKHKSQCRDLREEHEAVLEEWYHNERKEDEKGLEKWLCHEKLKMCCDKGYFGPDCEPCTGGAEKPCSGHGTCRGSGSRKGNGTCKCHRGYSGDVCDQCASGYFMNSTTERCDECDQSCADACREGGPKGCLVCKTGYTHTQEWGCVDVDECIESDENPCKGSTFCANHEGGYACLDCDRSCDGCYYDGPDNCAKCARGYELTKGICTQFKERSLQVTLSRWAVHLGLVICTVIISKKSLTLSSIIGACVAVYIGACEYTTGDWENFDVNQFFKGFVVN